MKISIVIPSYNQGRFIKKTINSILDQKYPDLEVIVVDGGSTDNTLEILKSFKERISWISEKDKGQAEAINKGLKMANGEILAYLNSDDVYLANCLKTVSEFFLNYPDKEWVTGFCQIITEEDKPAHSFIKRYKESWLKRYSYRNLLLTNFISQPATFWRRSAFNKIGFFNEDLNFVMDYDYWLRLGKHYNLGIIHKDLAAFRIYKGSKSGSKFKAQFKEDYQVVCKYLGREWHLRILHRFSNAIIIFCYLFLNR